MLDEGTLDAVNATVSIIALAMSLIALYLTGKTTLLKEGLAVRGEHKITSNIDSSEPYVKSVLLENLKDRSVIVLGIYLRVARNYYIQLEDLEKEPLILKPFESISRHYGAVEGYSANLRHVSIRKLLMDWRVEKRLVLATPSGKYVVKPLSNAWRPSWECARNHFTAVLHAERSTFKDVAYGDQIAFLLELTRGDGSELVVPIHEKAQLSRLSVTPTAEAMSSRTSLEAFLRDHGGFKDAKFRLIDLRAHRSKKLISPSPDVVEAELMSWWDYHVMGRIHTRATIRELKQRNEDERRRRHNASIEEANLTRHSSAPWFPPTAPHGKEPPQSNHII